MAGFMFLNSIENILRRNRVEKRVSWERERALGRTCPPNLQSKRALGSHTAIVEEEIVFVEELWLGSATQY